MTIMKLETHFPEHETILSSWARSTESSVEMGGSAEAV
jgi:hypothetical protein